MKLFKKYLSVLLAICLIALPLLFASCSISDIFGDSKTETTTEFTYSDITIYSDEETPENVSDTTYHTTSQTTEYSKPTTAKATTTKKQGLDPDGYYYSKDEVALYIHTYGKLPPNFITKNKAKSLGWSGGSVEDYYPGGAIGGDRFGNYEGLLPKNKTYYECDIDTKGRSNRGSRRIIYSTDGSIYYTSDHYESFTQLY